ncbi:MAG: hypothetical protein ACP5N1_00395 [Candidatus Woesearchaeota archaeon]
MSKNISAQKVYYLSEKIIISLVLVLFLFLCSSYFVLGQVTIDTIDISPSLSENTTLTVYFEASDDSSDNLNVTGEIVYLIYKNGVIVATDNFYTEFMDYSDSGIYNFTLFAGNNLSNATEEQFVEVVNVPLTLNILEPSAIQYNTNNIPINLAVLPYADSCVYNLSKLNGSIYSFILNGVLTNNGQNFYGQLDSLADGNYSIVIYCSNNYDSIANSVLFSVNTLTPSILSKSYVFNEDNKVTFTVSTSVACTCKYDLQDRSYDLMAYSFAYTGNTIHSSTLTNLDNGVYTYYIKCKNKNNLFSNTELMSFSVITKPYASITLSKPSPLKAGTYKIYLKTTKPLNSAPTLNYNFNTDTVSRYVTLTGADTNWEGYIIIDQNTPDRVGTFHYSAKDNDGNIGDIITSGELFLVDTTKPLAPESVAANTQSDGSIKLKWYYDFEEITKYNIYRSTEGNPEYVDYYVSSSSTKYVDENVIDGITYYYRIAAVDNAGNIGLLSGIVQDTSISIISSDDIDFDSYENTDNPVDNSMLQVMDPASIQKINQLILEFNGHLLSIDSAKSDLNKINDPAKLSIISNLGLSEKITSAKNTIENLIVEANSIKNQNIKSSELDVKLNKLRMDALKAKSYVTEDIIINEQSSFDQVTQESDVNLAISEIVLVNLSKNIFDSYSDANKKLQDDITVTTEVFIFQIKYLGKDEYDKYTLVKKVVSSTYDLNNISIIEVIPKSFERKASDILFDIANQKKPSIVKDDPVLKWDNDFFNQQTIYYMINNHAELYSAKATKTIVLYTPNFKVTDTLQDSESYNKRNGLTGLIISNTETISLGSFSFMHWAIILGIGLILGLSTYYFSLDSIEKKRNSKRLKDHRIIPVSTSNVLKNSVNSSLENSGAIRVKKSLISNMFSKFSVRKLLNRNSLKISNKSNVAITKNINDLVNPVMSSSNRARNSTMTVNDFDDGVKNAGLIRESANNAINLKLIEANVRINNFDYENARNIYNYCLKVYSSNNYSSLSKKELKLTLDHLYLKLLVYRVIFLSRKHLIAQDYSSLREDIALMNKISIKLYSVISYMSEDYKDAELKFINYINNSKKHLESKLS